MENPKRMKKKSRSSNLMYKTVKVPPTIMRVKKYKIGKRVTKRKKCVMDLELLDWLAILVTSFLGNNVVTTNVTNTSDNRFADINVFF